VLVDGHKVNRPDMGGIEWQSIPVSNIERIEVIRGGQNVLYGNHALSGVVKITTKRGDDAGLQLDASMGSFGYRAGSVSYGETVGDVDFLAGVSSYWYDGYRSNSTSRATTFNASAGWFLNDTDTLTLRTSGGNSYIQFPGPLSYEEMQADPTQSKNLGNQFSEDQSALATLLYETERGWGAARVNTGLNFRDRDADFSGIYTWNRQLGLSLAPRARFGSEDDFWMAGLDLNYDRLNVENYLDEERTIVKSWAELGRISAAPYLFAQRTFAEKTILNGGVRYEYAGTDNLYVQYVEDQLEEFLGPFPNPDYKNPPDIDLEESYDGLVEKQGWAAELSVSQELSEQWDVFAGYDRVYRYPTLDETAAYQGFPLSDPLNENLDPEHGNNFEIGSKYKGHEWSASLTGFYLMLDNEIAYVEIPADPILGTPMINLNMNIGSTRRIGTEAEVVWSRTWYGASTRWTFVDARLENGENDGNRVPLVPWAYGTTSAWIEPVPEFRLTATYSYVAKQYKGGDEANTGPKMDPYGLFGLRANVAMSEHLNLVISMHNLFDETYAASAYGGGYYPGAGRSFHFGITMVY
ncbi:MAG: TonB-dependent receptor, partial [Verrucomicrobiota bacterium]